MSEAASAPAQPFRRMEFPLRDGMMAGIAFGPETNAPEIVFLHATGFNALTYRSLLAPLGDRLSVWALDARGHGRTTLPAGTFGYNSWTRHRDDAIELLEKHCTQPVTLAGHSMGGVVSLLIAGKRTDLVGSLALMDPVILPAAAYAFAELPLGPSIQRFTLPLARGAGARRDKFPDRASAVQAFKGRGVFKTFPPEVIEDYVEDGLVDDGKGGFRLACRPGYEAATYCAHRHDPWGALRRVTDPLVLLRAGRGSVMTEATLHRIAAIKPDARLATLEGAGHMLPMERPDRVRAAIETAALMARPKRRVEDLG